MKHIEVVKDSKILELVDIDEMSLILEENSHVILKLLNIDNNQFTFNAKLNKNSSLIVYFADFSKNNFSLISNVMLCDFNASCQWHLATLANGNSNKKIDVSFEHIKGHTSALMDNYGVARDKSSIIFSGCNHIFKGAKNSSTNQIAKIIVFDKQSFGTASPILKIDENEVNASHSAVVGQLNDDHMFYLMSRGLSKNQARELITRGYLAPISREFSEENKNKIEQSIKEAL